MKCTNGIEKCLFVMSIVLLLLVTACGGGGGGNGSSGDNGNNNPAVPAISISPTTKTIESGESITLTVTASNTGITWPGKTGDTANYTQSGNSASWTPPAAPGTYSFTVTATADTSKKATAAITVKKTPIPPPPDPIDIEMVDVPGGTFTMGCTAEQGDNCGSKYPAHQVTVSPLEIGTTEVTQAQWKAVMGDNPSHFKGDNLPVASVSWNDVQEFIQKLNVRTGKNYRLPTEAEWEYTARGGANKYKYSGSDDVNAVAWYLDNCGGTTHAVGTKQLNEFGLYDMSGNVWEWVQDWYGSYSSEAQTNPTGPTSGSGRVMRGGSCAGSASEALVSVRSYGNPSYSGFENVGFRLASGSSEPQTKVNVPNVVNKTEAAAKTAITGAGLKVGTITTAASSTVAAGNVISQSPAAGASVAKDSSVSLVIATQPLVSVPNVVNKTQAAASTAITGAGLKVGTITTAASSTVAAGSVISQNPTAGTSVATGSSVSLVIATQPLVNVPNVVNKTEAAASTAITGAGLKVGTITTAASSTVAAGNVISQNPAAGASVATGSSVSLVIATQPLVNVPNVVNKTEAAAKTAITGAGLTVGTITTATSSTVAAGNVISQNPTAGTSVNTGSTVSLVVSTGPGDDETEPNDTEEQANPLPLNKSFSGRIGSGDSADYFNFTTTKSGKVTVKFTATTTNPYAEWGLRLVRQSPDPEAIINPTGNEKFGGNYKSGEMFLQAGTYYVQLYGWRDYENVPYTLLVQYEEDGGLFENERNNTVADGKTIALNKEKTGSILNGNDVDLFLFTLAKSGKVTVKFTASTTNPYAEWGLWLVRQSPDPVTIINPTGNEKFGWNYKSGEMFLQAGTYYVQLSGWRDYENVPYSLLVQYVEDDGLFENERNNTIADGKTITLNKEKTGSILNSQDVDLFLFTLAKSGKVTVKFTASTTNPYAEWGLWLVRQSPDPVTIINPTGNEKFGWNYKSGEMFLQAGTYYVQLSGWRDYENVPYSLLVQYAE